MSRYVVEMIHPREGAPSGEEVDAILKHRLFRCGGGAVDRVYGYRFNSRTHAERARRKLEQLFPKAQVSLNGVNP